MDVNGPLNLSPEWLLSIIQANTDAKRLWVGYSGGVDSQVLLEVVYQALHSKTDYHLGAIHIHHGLSPNADAWMQHCENECAKLQIPLHVIWVDASVKDGRSPEEVAREARFQAFENFIKKDECLLLAHHAEDQAETILLRLFRGSGPQGLSGMQCKTTVGEGDLVRPLLSQSKEAIVHYAEDRKLKWINDESNFNTRFDRNFLREEIMPRLSARWPRVVRSVGRAGALCFETATAIQVLAEEDLNSVKGNSPDTLSVKKLLSLEPVRRRGVLRYWLSRQKLLLPSRDHLARIDREILQAKPDSKPRLKLGNYELRRIKGELKAWVLKEKDIQIT